MRAESVEIYSDATNAAVLRHPARRFPGCLIQGDTLSSFLQSIRVVRNESHRLSPEAADELADISERLEGLLAHYKSVLIEHNIPLPFFDKPEQ